jgi:hypothetical protein
MKRKRQMKREFTAADIQAAFDGLNKEKDAYSRSTVKKVAYGIRNNRSIRKALQVAKKAREKAVVQISNISEED